MIELRLQDQYLFKKVLEDSPIGMTLVSADGKFLKVNQSLCKMLGYNETELTGLTFQSITFPGDLEENMELRGKAITGEIDSYRMVKRYIHKSGELIWGLLSVTVERDAQGNLVFFISQVVDITEQKIREEKIKDAEKLSVIGELAAGIAHEIRNPLTSLRGFVQLFKSEDTIGVKRLRHEVMLSEIDRINEIVSELLVLAKPSNETFELGSISEKLNHVVTLFEGQANLYNVEIHKDFDVNLPLMYSQDSIKQVFINLLKNAIESMPNGGKVLIQAKEMDDKLLISFIDQGCGIPENQLAKIGRPFFTTKESGTGLGLMVSQRIIQNHKGVMQFKSELGRGTNVEILLPVN
jgi:two-component system sporulation sensor kinase A